MERTDSKKEEIILKGIGVSPGIAIGPVHVEARGVSAPDLYQIPESEIEYERGRLAKALEKTKQQLEGVRQRVETLSGGYEGQIFEAHLLIIEDASIARKVKREIESRLQNAEYAFYAVIQTYTESLRRVNDPYLVERAADLDDICKRVLRNFSDSHAPEELPDHQHVLIAYDIAPSDTATMDPDQVLGFATEQGSTTSHTAILARSLGIPAVVGIKDAVMDVQSLSMCIIDGDSGVMVLHPNAETIDFYRKKKHDLVAQESRDFAKSRDQKVTQTADGHVVHLSANIEFAHEVDLVRDCGAEGVGLFRSEFFLLGGGEIPSEEEQYENYRKVAEGTGEHLAIIRTLDAGGDKLPAEPLDDPEPNPFLGWRGIRVSLSRMAMFKTQLRGVLRASAYGKLGVMFPLVSGLTEVREAKEVLRVCMEELESEAVDFDRNIQVGIMIEVPSAAIMASNLAAEVDFFSIGTNDLIQYTVAVDRVNPQVSHLYKPCNPAVIRLIKMTVDAGQANDIWTGVCGEMAGMLEVIPLLIGLGVKELSVGTHQLPKIKKAIGELSMSECKAMSELALNARTSSEITALSSAIAESAYGEYMTQIEE